MFVSGLINLLTFLVATWIYMIVATIAILFARFCLKNFKIQYDKIKGVVLFNYMLPFVYTISMLIAGALTRSKILIRVTQMSIIIWVATIVFAYWKQTDKI